MADSVGVMAKTLISFEQQVEIIRKYVAGATATELKAEYNISENALTRGLKLAGVKRKGHVGLSPESWQAAAKKASVG